MKVKSSKNLARHEKKKEKLAALLAVTKLNEKDRSKETESRDITYEQSTEPACKKSKKHSDTELVIRCPDATLSSASLEDITVAKDISESCVKSLKQEYKECTSRRKAIPKIRLKQSGERAELSVEADERVPLMLTDVQHLLLHSLLHDRSPYQPSRWYNLDKGGSISHTTCLVLEGISLKHWHDYHSMFTFIDSNFQTKIEVITPAAYDGSLVEELAAVPLSNTEKECLIKKYGSMDSAMEYRKDLMVMMKAVFPIEEEKQEDISAFNLEDKFPRTQLILSAWQLVEENYPLPLKGKLKSVYADYVMTKDIYKPVTAKSPMFGLDCEMCMTSVGSELTRVSLVNEKHETVYETLVQPYNNIVNYLTMYSGITKAMMAGVTKRLEEVQKELRDLLPPDAILVGQSLNSDLNALKMMHPYVIDTSVIFNITGERTRKPKLKTLAFEFLKQNIQVSKSGHCSVEDSLASLKLVQLKLCKNMEYGDAVLAGKKRCEDNLSKKCTETETQYASTIFNHMVQQKVSSTIVGCEDILGDYHDYLTRANECCNSLLLSKKGKPKKVKLNTVEKHCEVIETVCKISKDNHFTMAHLKLDILAECANSQIKIIDQWVREIWEYLPGLTLFVVILGGTKTENGAVLIQIKKP